MPWWNGPGTDVQMCLTETTDHVDPDIQVFTLVTAAFSAGTKPWRARAVLLVPPDPPSREGHDSDAEGEE